MRRVFSKVAVGVFAGIAAAGMGAAHGQQGALSSTSTVSGSGELGATAQSPSLRGPRTLFTLEGTTVHIWAPIQEPYSGSAYETIAGQPMKSGDSILTPGALRPGQ